MAELFVVGKKFDVFLAQLLDFLVQLVARRGAGGCAGVVCEYTLSLHDALPI